MKSPTITDLNSTYKRPDVDFWVLNTDDMPVEKELVRDQQVVHLAPESVGGNHFHSRTEWIIGIGDLVFVWLDEEGRQQETHMHPEGRIRLSTVPPMLPHAVVNKSRDKVGVLYEMADGKMKDVTPCIVY